MARIAPAKAVHFVVAFVAAGVTVAVVHTSFADCLEGAVGPAACAVPVDWGVA